MGNYEELKQAVSAVIKENGNQEITGNVLQSVLLSIVSIVGNNSTFAGVAIPTTIPGTPDQNVFYICSTNGVYPNFGNISLLNEVAILTNKNGQWNKITTDIASNYKIYDVIKEIENIKKITINGNVTNNPDNEDIESVIEEETQNGVLKFKDREYNPLNYSGKGYVILRKNITDGKNVLTQENINKENTIYEIRYDFDLNEQEIIVPNDCILFFNGGSLKNGTLYGNNTTLINCVNSLSVSIGGTFGNIKVDDVIDDYDDVSSSINKLSNLFKDTNVALIFSNREYKTKNTIDISGLSVIGNNATIIADIDNEDAVLVSRTFKQGVFVKDITIDCNDKNNIGFLSENSNDIRFNNISIKRFKYIGFFYKGGAGLILNNFYFAASKECFDYCRAFYTEKPDVSLSNGMIEYAPIAIDTIGGDFSNIHIWGIPTFHNCNIGILQRHTNVQMTNIEFDSILSKNNEEHNPEYRYDTQSLNYKKIYHGGCGILSLLDSFSAFASKLTINSSIDLQNYNTPIYIRTINGNYAINDIAPVTAFGYNVVLYSFADGKTAYKSNLAISKTKSDFTQYSNTPNGTVIPASNGIFNMFDSGKLYRATNAKFQILSKHTYKLCNFNTLPKYNRNFIYLTINNGGKKYDVDISINNNSDIYQNIADRIKIFGLKPNNLFFYVDDNDTLCMYNKNDYLTTYIAEISIYDIYTEVTDVGGESEKDISNEIGVQPYYNSSGTFEQKPLNPIIGFNYFCTDKQTSEGMQNGIMIYHKGNNVWVDCLGRNVI